MKKKKQIVLGLRRLCNRLGLHFNILIEIIYFFSILTLSLTTNVVQKHIFDCCVKIIILRQKQNKNILTRSTYWTVCSFILLETRDVNAEVLNIT